MATIVQDYGPIYGEVVNGTVQGRPNGSIYVPISNKIKLSIISANATHIKVLNSGGTYTLNTCNSAGTIIGPVVQTIAEAQDLASYISKEVYSDAELTTLVASTSLTAGNFNVTSWNVTYATADTTIVNGDTYYCIAKLMNNGVPVAVSDVVELIGYDSE